VPIHHLVGTHTGRMEQLTPPRPRRVAPGPSRRARPHLKFQGTLPPLEPSPLPPLPSARRSDPADDVSPVPEAPTWSPVTVAVPLFALVWVCFGALAAAVTTPPVTDVAGLAGLTRLLAAGAAVVALVLLTLSAAHTQVSGLRPHPAVIGVAALGVGQGVVAAAIGSGHADLWGIGAWVFVLIGVAVPLAWVGGQFQCGVRRHRVERHASLTASWIERARRQAHQTIESVHRHDARSMLFVIEGAARTLADGTLTAEQRASFGEMLAEGVQRLGSLMDVRSEEIQPFAVDGVARAVVHAERKAGRTVSADLPAGLSAVGRAADVAAVVRTLASVIAPKSPAGVQLRGERSDGAIVIRIEPSEADHLPLSTGIWDEIRADSFKVSLKRDEKALDLFVAARLLAEQGADLWSTAGRARFAVRLPALRGSGSEEEA
jgi:hypothetical protein